MDSRMRLLVAGDAERSDVAFRDRAFRHAPAGNVDLDDGCGHDSLRW